MNRRALVAALCVAAVAVVAVAVITTAVPREPQEATPADAPEDTVKNAGTDTPEGAQSGGPEGAQPEGSGAMASPQWRSEQLKTAGSEGEKELNKLSGEKGETGKDADATD